MVSMGLLSVVTATAYASILFFNRVAYTARLHTIATSLVQQKVDDFLTESWSLTQTRPAPLTAGTVTENNLLLNDDQFSLANATGETANSTIRVTATRVTTVSQSTTRLLTQTVAVSYVYRGRTYRVTASAQRASDTF
jgi:hypothetical protein